MCEGGTVVEWLAVDLGDTGSRPAVLVLFATDDAQLIKIKFLEKYVIYA